MKCVICQKSINKRKERYVNMRDYNCGKFESECFYHLTCWKERFQAFKNRCKEETEKQIGTMMKSLKPLTKQLSGMIQEVKL